MLWINWKSAVAGQQAGSVAHRRGDAAEWQAIRCADGWLALVYQPEDWPALRRFVDDARLDALHFATPALRREHGTALAVIIEAALMRYTRAEIRVEAQARRLPLGPVWSLAELLDDPHYQARGVFRSAVLPDGSTAPMASLPLTWDGARLAPGAVPA
jgi:crotonobetainyl-CoA:carnitine CoA-transferase CaiB-like acyl-CoA transferase